MALIIENYPLRTIDLNGTEFKSVSLDDKLLLWTPTVTWKTGAYAWGGWKVATVYFTPPPPVEVQVILRLGNGNNGANWATTDTKLSPSNEEGVEGSKYVAATVSVNNTGNYASVSVEVKAAVLDGDVQSYGSNSVTGSFRAYQIGNNTSGTIGTLNI